ncbi:gliding motility lipoprotein GldD [Maribacter confluentis]|uniref:Gliding motility-associated lipoprotein GldD n=2 Tax=Maribacter TaxID=252356 RepID=A0ABY1SI56_9FLAO|nr:MULTISPECIES: gliding motility lipoprotein GldD [Maribacter]MDO1512589.1 gliding motility lipoprotein GldD [Maribacter confluentis]SNR56676.1 gliding motility-associated lipoprotein GldD [Maribacter sedimenticola]
MKNSVLIGLIVSLLFVAGCQDDPIPKPKAKMRLEYPQGKLAELETENFSFKYNELAIAELNDDKAFTISYPEMKGAIFLSYMKIDGNLEKLIHDSKRLSYEHAAKADNIVEQPYVNPNKRVYGALFEVQGNAASQSQFFVTDSTSHFLTGSVYFYTKPNYDSILPAAAYLQNDIRGIIETLEWKH